MSDGVIDLIIKSLLKEIDNYSKTVSTYDEGFIDGLFTALSIVKKLKNGS